jgi:hypothetical protein
MTASAVCRPLPSCRGHKPPGSAILNCVLDGEAYAPASIERDAPVNLAALRGVIAARLRGSKHGHFPGRCLG